MKKLTPYVKEVCPTVVPATTPPLFAVSKICYCLCLFDHGRYRWFASYNDLKERTREFYAQNLEELKGKYELNKSKKEILEHVSKIYRWKELNDGELVKEAEKTWELLTKWWNNTIFLEGIKFADIAVFVDQFIKEKKLDSEEIILFKESLHINGINRETKKEIDLIEFVKKIKKGISDEEFGKLKYLYPKYSGYDGYSLYSKEELEGLDIEKMREEVKNRKKIDAKLALKKLKEKTEITKEDEENIEKTQYASQVLDERRYYANFLNICVHILIDEFSERLTIDRKELSQLTHHDFLDVIKRGNLSNLNYPKLFIREREVMAGEEAKKLFECIEEELEKTFEKEKILKGFGASAGNVTGNVRIILDPNEGGLKKGEILVTYYTNPEFVPLMKKAAGIITEGGGVTSHAAIVSRELGVPCVVGVKNAVTILKNGELVKLDGTDGIVERID